MKLNEIIALISNPDKSESMINKATVHLMAYVQQHPRDFRLDRINDELRNDLIYSMYLKFRHICEVYDKKRCPFIPYLKTMIYKNLLSLYRTDLKHAALEKSIISEYSKNYELYACEEQVPYVEDCEEYNNIENPIKQHFSKEDLLVLALKYNYYLSGRNIQKLAELTGLPLVKITDYIMAINKNMVAKLKKHEKNMNMIAKSYILKNRYLLEIGRLSDVRWSQKQRMLCSYKIQKQKLSMLQERTGAYMFFPSNSAISRVTGIPYRRVGRILERLKNKAAPMS